MHVKPYTIMQTAVLLTPTQRVLVHGWLNPKPFLTWEDVCSDPKKRGARDYIHMGITQDDLARIQPDVMEWVNHERVTLDDVPLLTSWPLHPITHFDATLLDILEKRYDHVVLKKVGIRYSDLKKLHMQPRIMNMFAFTEKEWHDLGFTVEDLRKMSEQDAAVAFQKSKDSVMAVMKHL